MSIIRNHKPVTVNTRSLFKVEQEMNIEKTRKRKKKKHGMDECQMFLTSMVSS